VASRTRRGFEGVVRSLRDLVRRPVAEPTGVGEERQTNVEFANDLLDTEIAQRNARKDAQENTARGVIVSSGLLLTLLLGLAKDAGLFSPDTSVVARIALAATVVLGACAATCAIGACGVRKPGRAHAAAVYS